MASRDNALFNVPRASHFSLLMADDEEDSSPSDPGSAVETSEAPAASSTAETIPSVPAKPSVPIPAASNDADGDDDWSCATRKTHQKRGGRVAQNGAPRASGFAHGHGKRGQAVPPVSVEQFNPEHTLEIFNFPSAWRTSDIRKFLSPFDGCYRLKWQNDTSCWVHFDDPSVASRALSELHSEEASLRVFAPENILPTASKTENSPVPTPETTIEVYGFPATWRAGELNKLLAPWSDQYRLKWRNDASCYVIFETPEALESARAVLANDASIKTRPYVALH